MKSQTALRAAPLLVLAACADPVAPAGPAADVPAPVAQRAAAAQAIPDAYIVRFADDVGDVRGLAGRLAAASGASVRFTYEHAVKGFAARMPAPAAAALARHPQVAEVEPDQVVRLDATQYMDGSGNPWGLDRINQRGLPLDGRFTYTYTGSGVYAYIVDTGIDAGHGQFGGRARNVYDAFGGNGNDCHGHGTHVAGTVGGATYGVAKKVRLRGLRVLGCDGSGSMSGIIAAVDWIRRNRVNPAVANMSLGGGYSSTLNADVNDLASSGVFVAVAAGNSNVDACTASPASASAAFTTAASTKTDYRASYSNHGGCVDAYAPGSAIKSAWIGSGSTETRSLSGTSMAAPHVAGVAALVKHRYGNLSSASVTTYLRNAATGGAVKGNVSGTPNVLLYKYVTAW